MSMGQCHRAYAGSAHTAAYKAVPAPVLLTERDHAHLLVTAGRCGFC